MAKIDRAGAALHRMDELAAGHSPIHALHPLAKLAVTAVYLFVTVSYDKYDLSELSLMLLYPAVIFSLSGIPLKMFFRRIWVILPFLCAVGIFNPLLDRAPLLILGSVCVSGGMVSLLTLLEKGVLCLSAAFLLSATTPIDRLCAALRRIRVPALPVTLFLLTYRYLALMLEEVSAMVTAYRLRAPGQRGLHYRVWGSFLGQLFVRTADKGEAIYAAMQLRGFHGEFPGAPTGQGRGIDWFFAIGWAVFFLLCRCCPVAQLLGNAVGGLL